MRGGFGGRLAAIVALGLGLRLLYALVAMRGTGVGGDGLEFHLIANQIAHGDGYIEPLLLSPAHLPSADKPPLYPLALALPSWLGWSSLAAHRVVSCLMGAGLVALTGLLGRRVGGERVGLLAALIAAAYPLLVALDGSLRSESLYAPLIALVLLAALRLRERPGGARGAALGAAIGLAALTRSEALALLVLLVLPLALALPRGLRLRAGAAAAAACALVLAPWIARNWIRFDRPLLSTNAGSLAYGANCHAAYYSRLIGTWACYPPLHATPRHSEADVSAELRRQGTGYASDHTGRLPVVAGVRLLRTWDLWSPASATRFEAAIADRDLGVYRAGVLVYYLLLPLALAGALLARRRGGDVAVLLAPVVLVVLVALAGYGTPRFRVPAEIPIVVLAATALDALVTRSSRAMIARVLVVVVALLAAAWSAIDYRDARRLDGAVAAVKQGSLPRIASSLAEVRGAGLLNPDRSTPLALEATLNVRSGRLLRARAALERLVRLEPANAEAWALLANLTSRSDPARSAQASAQVRRLDPYDSRPVR